MTVAKDQFLKQKIDATIEILKYGGRYFYENKTDKGEFPNWYSFYAATNENLHYYEHFTSFEDKDVLTVTASGDHAINAVYLGAKSVQTFDINELTFYAFELKQAAILNLTRDEFLDFYCQFPLFNKKIYDKFSAHLSVNTRTFFDAVLTFLEDAGINKNSMMENLVENYSDMHAPGNMIANNPYLRSKKTFKDSRKLIGRLKQPIRHKFCPAHKIGECFDKKDIVILSNILQYYFTNFYSDKEYHMRRNNNQLAQSFLKTLSKTLKPDGKVSLVYTFGDFPAALEEPCKKNLGVNATEININRRNRMTCDVVSVATAKEINEAIKE